MRRRKTHALRSIGVGLLLVTACKPGQPPSGGPVAPPSYAGDQAKCTLVKSQAEPLVVEWNVADRTKLESAVKKGVVAVRYEGCAIELLPECRVKGAYAWTPVVRKRDHVRIVDADALYAALPLGAARLEGKLATSGELNVDMTIVGRYELARGNVRADELGPECKGATHVVSAATAGAFRFFAGAAAEASAEAAAFGAAAGGTKKSLQETLNEDGSDAACAKASTMDKGAPEGCAAILRLEVVKIGEGKPCPPNTWWDGKTCSNTERCPRGSDRFYGSCQPSGIPFDISTACATGDVTTCDGECDSGIAASCAEMGFRYGWGDGVAVNATKSASRYVKACDGGSALGCYYVGSMRVYGTHGFPKDPAVAAPLFEKACAAKIAPACIELAGVLSAGIHATKDLARAVQLDEKACEYGSAQGCLFAGNLHRTGTGSPANAKRAAELWTRACDLGSGLACSNLAVLYERGEGVTKDLARLSRHVAPNVYETLELKASGARRG